MMRPVALPYILSAFRKANRFLIPDMVISLKCEEHSSSAFKITANSKKKEVFAVTAKTRRNGELELDVEFLANLSEKQRRTSKIIAQGAAAVIWGSPTSFAPYWNRKTIVAFGIGFRSKEDNDLLMSSKLLDAGFEVASDYPNIKMSLEAAPMAQQPEVDLAWVAFGALSQITGYYYEMINKCCELNVIKPDKIFERLISHWEILDQAILHPSLFVSPENN
jgi:hypothetical protein